MLFLSAQDMNDLDLAFSLLLGGALSYVVYQQYLHPLNCFPGPFWASLTDVWKVQLLRTGTMPAQLSSLHERYGDIVRIGPNELSFNNESAVKEIYKAGRAMEKGPLYDGFTSFKPNVFGLRDEEVIFPTLSWKRLTKSLETCTALASDGSQFLQHSTSDDGEYF